jgi:hypothetical protein
MESLLLDNERGQYPTNIGNSDDGASDDHEPGEGLTLRLKNVRPRNEDEEQGEDYVGNDEDDHAQIEDDRPVKRLRFLMSDRNSSESMQEEGEGEGEGEIEGEGEEEGIVSTDRSTASNSLRLVISREGGDGGGHKTHPTSSNHTMQKPQLRNRGSSSSQLDEAPATMRASRRGPAETAKIDRGTGARTSSRASTRASASKSDHSELEEEEGQVPSYGAQDEDDDNDSDDDDDKPVADDEDSQSEESDDSVPRSSRRKSKTKAPTPTRSSSRRRSVVEPPTSASKRLSGRSRVSYAEADSDEESEDDEDEDRADMEDKENRSESDTAEANDAVNHTATRRSGRESAGRNKLYDVKAEQETAVIVKRESRGRVIPPPPLPVLPTRSRVQINQDNGRQRRLPAARTSSSSSSSSAHPTAAPATKPLQHYRIDSDTKANMNLILSTIETADKQNLFAESVTDEEAPGYSEIVLNPMDLGTAKYVITHERLLLIAVIALIC